MANQEYGRGNFGNPEQHAAAGHQGGVAAQKGGHAYDIAQEASKGGHAAQESGHAHKLTDEERSEGGSNSGGNFKNDPERAKEAGRR